MSNDDTNLYDFIALYSLKILFECVAPFNPHSNLMRWVVSLSYKWGSLNLRFVWDHASHMLRPEAGQLQGLSSLSTLYPCLFLASAPSAVISTDIPVSCNTFMCGFKLWFQIKLRHKKGKHESSSLWFQLPICRGKRTEPVELPCEYAISKVLTVGNSNN